MVFFYQYIGIQSKFSECISAFLEIDSQEIHHPVIFKVDDNDNFGFFSTV